MADYSTAKTNATSALNESTDGGFVEEYQIGRKRVRRGKAIDQARALAFIEGMANRRGGGIARLAKFKRPQA